MSDAGRPLRADAERNRQRILAATRAVLVEQGLDAAIDEIAARADVGVGTIYRRFGNRDALVRAVTLDSIAALADSAERAADSGLAPDKAFTQFVWAAVDQRLGVLAAQLLPVMSTSLLDDEEFRRRRDRLLTGVETLIRQGQADRSLRRDVGPADVLLGIVTVSRPMPGVPAEFEAAQMQRTATLLLDGLLTRTPTEIGDRPGTRADLDRALRDARDGGRRTR